jgi:hypothetical protein
MLLFDAGLQTWPIKNLANMALRTAALGKYRPIATGGFIHLGALLVGEVFYSVRQAAVTGTGKLNDRTLDFTSPSQRNFVE